MAKFVHNKFNKPVMKKKSNVFLYISIISLTIAMVCAISRSL